MKAVQTAALALQNIAQEKPMTEPLDAFVDSSAWQTPVTIPRHVAADTSINLSTKGLMVYLSSAGKRRFTVAELSDLLGVAEDHIDDMVDELIEIGYLQ